MDTLDSISVANLLAIAKDHIRLPRAVTRTRAKLLEALRTQPADILNKIREEAAKCVSAGKVKHRAATNLDTRQAKRPRRTITDPSSAHAWDAEVQETRAFNEVPESRVEQIIESCFLRAPSTETLTARLCNFIDATSKSELDQAVCGSCARIRFMRQLKQLCCQNIPHKELLKPIAPHPAHVLHDGLLLQPESITTDGQIVFLCDECLTCLKRKHRPQFSLGNNMWVGDVPFELQNLTLPERMLIARYFPAAYIIKLFPKQKGSRAWDRAQMHNGLRGNVSTYRLDPKQVASMINGVNYPPHPKILSATIGITFVGPKGQAIPSMPNMFRVRRRKVEDALRWLQKNNPLYSDIVISESSLALLPTDGVPDEMMETAKYSSDVERLEREHAGYVPPDAADEEDRKFFFRKRCVTLA